MVTPAVPAAPDALKWFQLYIYKDRKVTENLVKRAEKAGFKAIVLTVDAPYFGRRLPDIRNKVMSLKCTKNDQIAHTTHTSFKVPK